jgi:hypothetical protein
MNHAAINSFQIIKIIVAINFYMSAILIIAGGFLSVTGYSVFQFNEDLYGALDNNLRMIMLYLAFSECFVVGYCFFSKKFEILIFVGSFLILMIGSMAFYGEINALEFDPNFPAFFLYTGISHIIFGALDNREKTQHQ